MTTTPNNYRKPGTVVMIDSRYGMSEAVIVNKVQTSLYRVRLLETGREVLVSGFRMRSV